MNRVMWANAATQANVATLRAPRRRVLGPGRRRPGLRRGRRRADARGGGDRGGAVRRGARRDGALAGRHVVITAGPTREALDPVRFISNRSSGKMGYAIAQAAREAGAASRSSAGR
jgi:phosphopantothenoylcysteine decarboxylase / phosphopantothenate---cysteine ligase